MTGALDTLRGRPQACILLVGLDPQAEFLALWRAWRTAGEHAPTRLHVVAVDAFPQRSIPAQIDAALQPLADELGSQWWGLIPGMHRLSFEGGRVQLTVYVGAPADAFRELSFTADLVRVGRHPPAMPVDANVLRAIARLCRRGSVLQVATADAALHRHLASTGFRVGGAADTVDSVDFVDCVYDPAWMPKALRPDQPRTPTQAIVVGAGLAGAAAAASLAARGWQVTVIDAADEPAAGASGLPAGLMAPHLSPDENLLSRLSRSGTRITRREAETRLEAGVDWSGGGTLEHRLKPLARPLQSEGFAADWSRAATADEKQQALLPDSVAAAWHVRAGWVQPGALVRAWLRHPDISFRGGVRVQAIERDGEGWALRADDGGTIARAPVVVVAAALSSAALLRHRLALHAVRGQVSWARRDPALALPARPVNGNGHFLPSVPMPEGSAWMCGSSYGRGDTDLRPRTEDHRANFERVGTLLPMVAAQLAPAFAAEQVQAWTGIRCASGDRRPLVGELAPGLWVSTAMGSRGLSFTALCAEMIACRLHSEPLPLPLSLAMAIDVNR